MSLIKSANELDTERLTHQEYEIFQNESTCTYQLLLSMISLLLTYHCYDISISKSLIHG